ncbi:hypothetical protein TPA0598_04_06070 [Streptomyces lydicamycinicus]|uniref:Uncharacterized protein n=1 Tax=Streptomyces lydicamycinicus TaxID=1546107 RepID=A0A0N7YLJ3_9ACTN|nr:hypothetical protein [Streptomyces lydicamycinicus]GAO08971.1 hypothetical protein TPA0598_04_06070 [Streptomyces lydicamycinicus]
MRAYPYPRLSGAVTSRVTAVRLRGPGDVREDLDTKGFSVVEHVVALGRAERDDWHTARLSLSATIPAREIAEKGRWSEVAVVAVLTEKATNARFVTRLGCAAGDGKEWAGEIEVHRPGFVDRASLAVHVVATVDGVAGRIIGSTEREWMIDVTADVPLRDRELDVTTSSFARGAAWLRPYRDAPWIVDPSGRMPTVRLNSDFEGLLALVEGEASKVESVVGEMLMAQMCTDVWTAVFHTAIGDLEIEDDGTPLLPPDWRGEVLREMLPDVVPGHSVEDALREVHTRRRGDGSWAELQPRIHIAATRRAGVPKTLTDTVRKIERLEQENHA